MKIRICDLCRKNYPDAKIKYKAKKEIFSLCESHWVKIELCEECLDKIINATTKDKMQKVEGEEK